MSVLSCERRGCGNVMCDRYSPDYGYICDSCFDELVTLGPSTTIMDFMKHQPQQNLGLASRAFFDSIFSLTSAGEWKENNSDCI